MLQAHHIIFFGEMILGLGGLVRVGIKHLVAVLRISGFLEREIAALGKYFYLLEFVGLCHRKPYVKRFAGIGNANGERVIQFKVARLALGKSAKSAQQKKRDCRNSAQHNSSFRLYSVMRVENVRPEVWPTTVK